MRKIAAHYWLRPDGSVGKFPVIIFDNKGIVKTIRERSLFTEEPNMELINGLLIPAFVDVFPEDFRCGNMDSLQKNVNKYIISGTRVLGINKSQSIYFSEIKTKGLVLVDYDIIARTKNSLSAFETIKATEGGLKCLMKYTAENAQALNVFDKYGSLEVGKTPGIYAISGVDYQTFQLSPECKIKKVI